MAKMDVSAAKMALAVWNGYVWDARHVHGQWRPVEQALHDAMVRVSQLVPKAGLFVAGCDVIFSSSQFRLYGAIKELLNLINIDFAAAKNTVIL